MSSLSLKLHSVIFTDGRHHWTVGDYVIMPPPPILMTSSWNKANISLNQNPNSGYFLDFAVLVLGNVFFWETYSQEQYHTPWDHTYSHCLWKAIGTLAPPGGISLGLSRVVLQGLTKQVFHSEWSTGFFVHIFYTYLSSIKAQQKHIGSFLSIMAKT